MTNNDNKSMCCTANGDGQVDTAALTALRKLLNKGKHLKRNHVIDEYYGCEEASSGKRCWVSSV